LSYLADTQADKQTKSGKNITSMAEVKKAKLATSSPAQRQDQQILVHDPTAQHSLLATCTLCSCRHLWGQRPLPANANSSR